MTQNARVVRHAFCVSRSRRSELFIPGLKDKRILVAGGTGTVGRFLVNAQLAAGATVIVPSRGQAKLDTLAASLDPALRERLVPLVGDVTDDGDATELLAAAGRIDGAVATIGRFTPAPALLDAPRPDLEGALANYTLAHFSAAKALLPVVEESGGAYVMINGSLAFEPEASGTGIVSIAGAAQSMLARVLMNERESMRARINEVVIYSNLRSTNNEVTGEDIGRFVGFLLSDQGSGIRSRVLHLRSRQDLTPSAP